MKSINSLAQFTISILVILLLVSSCNKETELDRDKFIGTYNVSETCDSGQDSYNLTISTSNSGDDMIIINNLHNQGNSLGARVNSSAVAIDPQTLDGIMFQGGGTYGSNDILSINFILTVGSDAENCNVLCTKL